MGRADKHTMADLMQDHLELGELGADPVDGRWFGVGSSTDADGFTAGARATAAAVAGRPDAGLVLVFAREYMDMDALIEGVRAHAGATAKIAGCSTVEPMAASGEPADFSVSVVAFGGHGFGYEIAVGRDVAGNERAAGGQAASGLALLDHPHKVLLLFVDALLDDNVEIVRGAYGTAGAAVPLVGGVASDNWQFARTYQFAGDSNGVEILSGTVVGVAIGSPAPGGLGGARGWRRARAPLGVSGSGGPQGFAVDKAAA